MGNYSNTYRTIRQALLGNESFGQGAYKAIKGAAKATVTGGVPGFVKWGYSERELPTSQTSINAPKKKKKVPSSTATV